MLHAPHSLYLEVHVVVVDDADALLEQLLSPDLHARLGGAVGLEVHHDAADAVRTRPVLHPEEDLEVQVSRYVEGYAVVMR